MTKRKLVWLLGILAAIVVVPVAVLVTFLLVRYDSELLNTAGKADFERVLPIPKLAESTVAKDGTRVFNLKTQAGTTEFYDGIATKTWGVNGSYLGPTLRAKRGEKVRVNVTNGLPETTSMHWHGMHVPAIYDGGPHQPIKPGETWSPHWTINQPAATLWYHPHPHGETEKDVYRGISGMFIVDDDNPTAEKLPHDYGADDIPVIVQDKIFTDDKQLDEKAADASIGRIGNVMLVNGAITPHFDASTSRVRLRILNASTARIYNFGLSNGEDMQMIASDAGLLEKPVIKNRLRLSPGERAEVIVTLRPNETVSLRSYPADMRSGTLNNRAFGADDTLDIIQLRAGKTLKSSPEIPAQLANIKKLEPSSAVKTRDFVLDTSKEINGKSMDMNRIDETVTLNTNEIWQVTNEAQMPHSFHVHDVHFQVLSADAAPPPPELRGWKDTVLLLPGQKVRLIMRFADYSDPVHPYMFHCHLLRHEDDGMMGQFKVVKPGETSAPAMPMNMPGM